MREMRPATASKADVAGRAIDYVTAMANRRRSRPEGALAQPTDQPPEPGLCPICERPVVAGPSADRHHWTPKSKGGRQWSWVHQACHRKIHSLWSASELVRQFNAPEPIRAHPEMERFVSWIARKHPEFNDATAPKSRDVSHR